MDEQNDTYDTALWGQLLSFVLFIDGLVFVYQDPIPTLWSSRHTLAPSDSYDGTSRVGQFYIELLPSLQQIQIRILIRIRWLQIFVRDDSRWKWRSRMQSVGLTSSIVGWLVLSLSLSFTWDFTFVSWLFKKDCYSKHTQIHKFPLRPRAHLQEKETWI